MPLVTVKDTLREPDPITFMFMLRHQGTIRVFAAPVELGAGHVK